ncbi:MAG TPA: esterase-like activity of phytase family protein [Actinopolymorphaceae bacterium]
MRSRIVAALIALGSVLASSCVLASPATADDAWQVRLLGEHVVPKGLVLNGAPVGELSGIDYDRRTGVWYLVSDDTEDGPARFYTAELDLDSRGLHDVTFTDVREIRRTDGSPFPALSTDDPEVADPEAIRFDARSRTLWWSSEGKRDTSQQLVDPWVREMTLDGDHLRQTRQPSVFTMRTEEVGPRANGVFEGLALSTDGRYLVTSMEAPLFQDGTAPEADHRITFYDKRTGRPIRQVAYPLDDLPGNGISEILAIDRHRYLVVERNYVAELGNSIRAYEIDVRGATNVLRDDSLADGDYRPVRKRLVLDLADLGLDKVDNIEAVSWGPRLATGERTLVFVSDDNFNDTQIGQVVAVAVRR